MRGGRIATVGADEEAAAHDERREDGSEIRERPCSGDLRHPHVADVDDENASFP
jgi:hypothetical protein